MLDQNHESIFSQMETIRYQVYATYIIFYSRRWDNPTVLKDSLIVILLIHVQHSFEIFVLRIQQIDGRRACAMFTPFVAPIW